jgi:hypothetical protein
MVSATSFDALIHNALKTRRKVGSRMTYVITVHTSRANVHKSFLITKKSHSQDAIIAIVVQLGVPSFAQPFKQVIYYSARCQ